ncbi:MAG: hypothetical protein G01um101416_1059 [Microgenomates group bacterium Gr01-1014_16]|nr:MAG: hypothetical protein G01um101416_1059 [Microgenomates group bacterium Gr01-1014_16]
MKVVVEFEGGKIRPVRFWRGTREYEVKGIPMVFERRDGGRKYMCFAVDTGAMMAELRLDLQNFQFSICKEQSCI